MKSRFTRFRNSVVAFVLAIFFIVPFAFLTANAEEGQKGLSFYQTNPYEGGQSKINFPLTYEATVYFPKDFDKNQRGGVIFGSYDTDKLYCFNFEIHKNGMPRLYTISYSGEKLDVTFDKVSVLNGKETHIAITADRGKSVWSCYVNGELAQTVNMAVPADYVHTKRVCLGGDNRADNGQYFKGVLLSAAFAAETRTPEEIKKDYLGTSEKSGFSAYYDLTEYKPGETPPNVQCEIKKGPTFKLDNTWMVNKKPVTDYDYTFAVFGDTQSITEDYPEKLGSMYDWVIENKEEEKIEFVIGLGDMVDNYTKVSEWECVKEAVTRLDGKLPYSIVRGNHDNVGMYKEYFPQSRYKSVLAGSYDDTTMLNTYQIFTVGNVKYLILSLDFLLEDGVLDWAGKVISENPDCNVIVTTHIYLAANAKTIGSLSYNAENTGTDLWEKLISKHENIVLVLCGHSPTDKVVVRTDKGEKGNTVTQVLIDPQGMDKDWKGGTGMVGLFHFSEGGSKVQVEYYSIIKDAYYLSQNQLELSLSVVDSDGRVWAPGEKEAMAEVEETTPEETDAETTPRSDEDADDEKSEGNIGIYATVAAAVIVALAIVVFLVVKKKKSADA